MWTETKRNGGLIYKMSKDEIFEATKSVFDKWDKEDVIEYLSSVLSELLSNGVSISACEIEPPYIEYADDDGILKRDYARRDVLSIREQVTLNFSRHDKEVKDELTKELIKNIPTPNAKKYDEGVRL